MPRKNKSTIGYDVDDEDRSLSTGRLCIPLTERFKGDENGAFDCLALNALGRESSLSSDLPYGSEAGKVEGCGLRLLHTLSPEFNELGGGRNLSSGWSNIPDVDRFEGGGKGSLISLELNTIGGERSLSSD